MNLANKLTIARMILVVIMLVIPLFHIPGEIGGVAILAIVFDFFKLLDSVTIARSRNQITTFGKFLDPIADKIMVLVAMMLLLEMGKIPAIIPAIILTREFLISGFRLIAVEKNGNVIAANNWGKLKTVTQIIAIGFAFIDRHTFGNVFGGGLPVGEMIWNGITTLMMVVCVIATIFSGIEYMKGGKDLFKDDNSNKKEKAGQKE